MLNASHATHSGSETQAFHVTAPFLVDLLKARSNSWYTFSTPCPPAWSQAKAQLWQLQFQSDQQPDGPAHSLTAWPHAADWKTEIKYLYERNLKPHNRNWLLFLFCFFVFALMCLVIGMRSQRSSFTSVMRCGSSTPSSPAKEPNHWWKQPWCFTHDKENHNQPHRPRRHIESVQIWTGPATDRRPFVPFHTSASQLALVLLHHAKSPNARTLAHTRPHVYITATQMCRPAHMPMKHLQQQHFAHYVRKERDV